MYENFMKHLIKKSELSNNEFFEYNKSRKYNKDNKEYKYSKIENPNFNNYIVLDFETTGLSPIENEIIEIGAIKVENSIIIDEFSQLIKPKNKIPPFIEDKIHITNDMVKDMPYIEDIFKKFISFLDNYPLVIHNAKFDMSFLLENAKKFDIKINNSAFDTVSGTKKLFPELKKYNLAFLCKNFNIINLNYHRAIYDVKATYYLYEILYNKFMNRNL